VLAISCSGGAEHAAIGEFFAAARLRDLTALERIATATFEPREHGTVLEFAVQDVKNAGSEREAVSVDARVRLPDGRIVQRRLDLTLAHRDNRWIVTEVIELPVGTPPR